MALATNNGGVAVIGCGVLGTSLCKQLLESPQFESSKGTWTECVSSFPSPSFLIVPLVTGVTKSMNRHGDIRSAVGESDRFSLATAEEIEGITFKDVVFCAPPSGFEDYPAAVDDAISNVWDQEGGGTFVFTSSGGM